MADASTVTPGLATLGGAGWNVTAGLAGTHLGAGTFAQMKAIVSPPDAATFTVTNYGRGGSLWRYSASLADWFPSAPCKVFENTALITGVAQLADQLLLAIPLEAGLLAGKTFRLVAAHGKTGATDASGTFSVRMGTTGTIADTAVLAPAGTLTAANRSVGFEAWLRMASPTSVNKLGGGLVAAWSGNGSSTLLNAATTVPSVASQATFLTLTTTMGGTTDSPQLGYVALEIQP